MGWYRFIFFKSKTCIPPKRFDS